MNWKISSAALALLGSCGLTLAAKAHAEKPSPDSYPVVTAEGYLDFRLDAVSQSDDDATPRWNGYLRGEANLGLDFTPEFSLKSRITVDSMRAPRPHRDRFVSGTGAFLEQLYLDYQTDDVGAYAGKFGPTFGIAWDRLPDLLKDCIAGDYELAEMIGFGGALKLDLDGMGKHEINAAAFFLDTSLLHRSLFSVPSAGEDRAERISNLRRGDGGLANTGKPNSFSATLGGSAFADAPGLFYQLGYRHLARGATESKNEDGLVGALGYEFKLADEVSIAPFVELAHFWNFNGGNANATVVTAALQVTAEPWNMSLAASWRGIGDASPRPKDDYSAGFQVGYGLGNGFEVGAGYRHERIDSVSADIVRAYIGYSFDIAKTLGR